MKRIHTSLNGINLGFYRRLFVEIHPEFSVVPHRYILGKILV